MNTDTDALAAYFEAWREGWPLPGGWGRDMGGSWNHLGLCDGGWGGPGLRTPENPSLADIQALTGVLVVELARRGIHPSSFRLPGGAEIWYARGMGGALSHAEFSTPLCALVAAWLEVNK